MRIIRDTADMQALALDRYRRGVKAVLVPTMGALHEGHLSLVRLARQHGDEVDVSIFVNPTQFGPNEDLSRYPRTLERDLDLCRAEGVGTVFCPGEGQIYAADHSTQVSETRLSSGLCGPFRPGHFDGVVMVVAKLFNIMQPSAAVFGQKDFQQVRVIQRMVRDLNFPVQIVVGPIVREPDGLAMSSRNRYLSADERTRALSLYGALKSAETRVGRGEQDAGAIVADVTAAIEQAGLTVQYVACVDACTVEPVQHIVGEVVFAVAAYVGTTRLIDNLLLRGPASAA